MADVTDGLGGLGEAAAKIKELAGSIPELTTNLGHFFQQFQALLPTSGKVVESIGSLQKSLENLDGKTVNLGSNFEHITFDLLGAAEGFDKLGGAALSSASDIKEAADGLKAHVSNILALADKLTPNVFKSMGLDMLVSGVKNVGEHAVGSAERVQQLERGYMALNVAGGNFTGVFDEHRGLVSDLDNRMTSFNEKMQKITAATGMAPGEVTRSLTELSAVPKALYDAVDVAGSKTDSLTAISKVAAGSMQDTSTVIKDVSFAYQYLSGDIQKQVEYAANLASAQQSLKLPMSDVRDAVQQVAQQYAMMSDNVDDTVKAMGLIVPAMEGVGLSGHQATKVFGDIMGAMSGLTDATESYMSSMSGGAGGLQGTFAFEEKLANDKKGAAQDLMKTMRESVGGEIVTRAEAAADISGQAASQYEKQRQMWEKLTGRKLDKGEEAKVFEAMQKGSFEGEGLETPTGQEALTKTAEQGTSVQEKMITSVTEIRNSVNAIAAAQDIQLGISILNKDKKLFGDAEAKHMKDAQVEATSNKEGSQISPDDIVKKNITEAANLGKEYVSNIAKVWSDKEAAETEGKKKIETMQSAATGTPATTTTETKPDLTQKVTTETKPETKSEPMHAEHATAAAAAATKTPTVAPSVPPSHEEIAKHTEAYIRATTPAVASSGPTATTVRTAAETQQTTPPAPAPQQTTIAVTGEIKGMCIKCQQETMVDDVAAKAVAMTESRDIDRRTSGAHRG